MKVVCLCVVGMFLAFATDGEGADSCTHEDVLQEIGSVLQEGASFELTRLHEKIRDIRDDCGDHVLFGRVLLSVVKKMRERNETAAYDIRTQAVVYSAMLSSLKDIRESLGDQEYREAQQELLEVYFDIYSDAERATAKSNGVLEKHEDVSGFRNDSSFDYSDERYLKVIREKQSASRSLDNATESMLMLRKFVAYKLFSAVGPIEKPVVKRLAHSHGVPDSVVKRIVGEGKSLKGPRANKSSVNCGACEEQ